MQKVFKFHPFKQLTSAVEIRCVTLCRRDHSVVHVGKNRGTTRCYDEASPVVCKLGGNFCSRRFCCQISGSVNTHLLQKVDYLFCLTKRWGCDGWHVMGHSSKITGQYDICILSYSWYGLQTKLGICTEYVINLDIRFNTAKSLILFSGYLK